MVDCWSVVCARCAKRRSERRDILTELYETELKYGRDLRIVVEEFYRPMLVAGLLSSDQLAGIFLNAEELIQVTYQTTTMRFPTGKKVQKVFESKSSEQCMVRRLRNSGRPS